VFTFTGRLRAAASFPARHNNVFQGLAADRAKLALWKLWRAGYRVVNFVHDESRVEVPDGPGLDDHDREVTRLMVAGMREVVPDVVVKVESVAARAWSKEAVRQVDFSSPAVRKPQRERRATDGPGSHAAEDPVHAHGAQATAPPLLGLEHTRRSCRSRGRDFRPTDGHGRLIPAPLA
jgi:hypothetical protein